MYGKGEWPASPPKYVPKKTSLRKWELSQCPSGLWVCSKVQAKRGGFGPALAAPRSLPRGAVRVVNPRDPGPTEAAKSLLAPTCCARMASAAQAAPLPGGYDVSNRTRVLLFSAVWAVMHASSRSQRVYCCNRRRPAVRWKTARWSQDCVLAPRLHIGAETAHCGAPTANVHCG